MHALGPLVITKRAAAALLAGLTLMGASVRVAGAQDAKPYDDQLMRLAEILGAVH